MKTKIQIQRLLLLTFELFLLCSFVSAQQNEIDSLLNIIKKDKEDTNKVNHLNFLSRNYADIGNFENALQYANEALHLANTLPNGTGRSGASSSYNNMGIIYMEQGDYPKALENYFKALKISEELGIKFKIAIQYGNLGNAYCAQVNYPKALEYYFKALKIGEELGDKNRVAIQLCNIGIVYNYIGDYAKSLEYYFKAQKMVNETENKTLNAAIVGNIGTVYIDMANAVSPDSVAQKEQLFSKALDYSFQGLKLAEEIESKNGITIQMGNIGLLYTNIRNYKEAEKYLFQSLSVAEEISSLDDIKVGHQNLSTLYEKTSRFDKALEHYKKYTAAKDSLFNEEKDKEITRKEMNYEFEKKEAVAKAVHDKEMAVAEAENRKQKIIRNSIGGGLAAVLLFSLVVYRQRNRISKEKKRSDELLLNILPSETAEELKLTGHAEPKQFDMVTVLFTDFKGFTQIAEKMSAKELVGELDFLFKKFDEIISKYPIEKIKTIGDAYMCAGGLPVANTTNPMDVVLAALEIQEFMTSPLSPLSLRRGDGGEVLNWKLRIGIHTGPIVAGIVGIKKFAYDIWGDTVNTASRMESSGEAGKVNISGTTYQLIKPNLNTQYPNLTTVFRGKVQAKNKEDIEMYFVERA